MATRNPESKVRTITLWEADMLEAAKKQALTEKAFNNFKSLNIRGGVLSVDDTPVRDNELSVVVLAAVHENQYYDKPFNANMPAVPTCYAFGDPDVEDAEDSMAPHADAQTPQGGEGGCAGCWANAMGSAEVGKGKACKNVRRLALVTADAFESPTALEEAEVRVLKVPVMSVKNWAGYVRNKLAEELARPYWGVVTKIKVVPDAKSQFKVMFTFEELVNLDDKLYTVLKRRISEVKGTIAAPYPQLEEQPAPPPRGVRPAARGVARADPAPKGRVAAPVAAHSDKKKAAKY